MMSVCLLMIAAAPSVAADSYEDRLITWALEKNGREREPNPEGLRIEERLVMSEEVFAHSDPWPDS